VIAAAFAGPEASAVNLAPSAVLGLWWLGLPLACVAAGDVMRRLDPFGTLARLVPGRSRAATPDGRWAPDASAWAAPAMVGVVAWWALAYHDARSPRGIGWFLLAYTVVAVAGVAVRGQGWARRGEGFGALSSALAGARRVPSEPAPGGDGTVALAGLVAVWLGAVVFDLFSGTQAWLELAGTASGWNRTGRATVGLLAAVVAAALVIGGTAWLADRTRAPRDLGAPGPVRRAVVVGWLATTAGVFLAHGVPVLLLEAQFALAAASDPFGRGWDLFGTARLTIDYSPLTPGVVGATELALAIAGALWGVAAAAGTLLAARDTVDARTALRALRVTGLVLAAASASAVAVLAAAVE
jgi:hypothetical protein